MSKILEIRLNFIRLDSNSFIHGIKPINTRYCDCFCYMYILYIYIKYILYIYNIHNLIYIHTAYKNIYTVYKNTTWVKKFIAK